MLTEQGHIGEKKTRYMPASQGFAVTHVLQFRAHKELIREEGSEQIDLGYMPRRVGQSSTSVPILRLLVRITYTSQPAISPFTFQFPFETIRRHIRGVLIDNQAVSRVCPLGNEVLNIIVEGRSSPA